jgi:hypothetical protein
MEISFTLENLAFMGLYQISETKRIRKPEKMHAFFVG